MDESHNSDEELLALLQPLTTPDEFTFERRLRHFADSSDDDVDQEPIPGPAPPAPMAPMAPIATVAPAVLTKEPNGVASLPLPETNGHKEDETGEAQDDDEIEYEAPKPVRKSPAKRPTRSRAKPAQRKEGGDESPYESAAELLKRFATSSTKKRVESKSDPEDDVEVDGGSQVKLGRRHTRRLTEESAELKAESSSGGWNFEVVIKPLSPSATQEYTKVAPGDEIYRVLEVIKTDVPRESWLSVEFEDGRVDQVSINYKMDCYKANSVGRFHFPMRASKQILWQQTKWKAVIYSLHPWTSQICTLCLFATNTFLSPPLPHSSQPATCPAASDRPWAFSQSRS